jgi:hypothetical protein
MPKRGPKPVDLEQLIMCAKRWATFLFGLRDGAPGTVERWEQKLVIDLVDQHRSPQEMRRWERQLKRMESEGWEVGWPVWPSPEAWEQLKRARSPKAMMGAMTALRKWRRRSWVPSNDDVLRALESDPRDLLRARSLPNYPVNAKTNDDKRVLFFAKILAGVELGLAPLTATKKLSHWRCGNYWKTIGVQYVASFEAIHGGGKP